MNSFNKKIAKEIKKIKISLAAQDDVKNWSVWWSNKTWNN